MDGYRQFPKAAGDADQNCLFPKGEKMKVIFHVDEPEKWQLALENVRNFLNAEPEAEIEVLANSAGVKFYIQEASTNDLFVELVGEGVLFAACNNALRKFGFRKEELPKAVSVVPAGVVELAERQEKGFAYIKP